jgi:hypothetical protein
MTAITSQTTIDIAVAGRRLEATLLGDGRTVVAYDNVMGRAAEVAWRTGSPVTPIPS